MFDRWLTAVYEADEADKQNRGDWNDKLSYKQNTGRYVVVVALQRTIVIGFLYYIFVFRGRLLMGTNILFWLILWMCLISDEVKVVRNNI